MKRLHSIDALRGFDMLLITGLADVVIAVAGLCGFGADSWIAQQFLHVEWDGLRLEDTIFPLFLFLAGVSWPFSCAGQRERGKSDRSIVLKCLKRAAILFVFGLAYGGLLKGELRMGSVLGRIGVAWMIGAVMYLFCRKRTLVIAAFAIPVAYWLLLYFVPAPDALTVAIPEKLAYIRDYGTGPFSIVGNLSGWFDRHFMPGILFPYTGIADNQSALGYIPAVGTALLGILTGDFLKNRGAAMTPAKRIALMFGASAALVLLGLAIANCFGELSMPVNKKLWSASFVFVVGGYSLAMLTLFHWIIDVAGFLRWSFFFRVVGMNSITIYLAQRFIPFAAVDKNLFSGFGLLLGPTFEPLVFAVGYLAVSWFFVYFLYRKNIFLKV